MSLLEKFALDPEPELFCWFEALRALSVQLVAPIGENSWKGFFAGVGM